MTEINKDDIVARECVLARYTEANDGSKNDLVLVKEHLHMKDGSVVPNVRPIQNYKRDFYITRKGFQNHDQKKEWEDVNKLKRYECTQATLADAVAKATRRSPGQRLTTLNRNPYVYGTDITTTSLVKYAYQQKWPDANSDSTLAVLDFETDVVNDTNNDYIVSGALTFRNRQVIYATKAFINDTPDFEAELRRKYEHHLKPWINDWNIEMVFEQVDTCADVVLRLMEKAHEWSPDFIGIWNITFDMNLMLKTLKAADINPADVFCDPRVPLEFRNFKWREQRAQKETTSGKKMNKHYAELWHHAEHLAGFYFIDMMCLFCLLRVAQGKRASYSLDAILGEELELGKLRIKAAEGLHGLDWHREMQQYHKADYLVYNLFDCLSCELLDAKNHDVSRSLRALTGLSPLDKFASNPRRLANDLHFYCLDQGLVIGSTSDEMVEEDDKYLLDMRGWIVTLPSYMRDEHSGLKLIKEVPELNTDIYAMVADLDVTSSYPTTEDVLNISKETTHRELCRLKGVPEAAQRRIGLNMTAAPTNAVEICGEAFKLPMLDQLLEEYRKEKA